MSDTQQAIANTAADLAARAAELSEYASMLAMEAAAGGGEGVMHAPPFLAIGLTVFVLACFVGYHVVWRVTPALHSPLMAITNAISSVIVVGAVMALGAADASGMSRLFAFLAVILASINIFGGFIITRRMLHMFRKKG